MPAPTPRHLSVGSFLVLTWRVRRQFFLSWVCFCTQTEKKKNQPELKGRVPLDSLTSLGHFIYHLPWIKRECHRGTPRKRSAPVRGRPVAIRTGLASVMVPPTREADLGARRVPSSPPA